jgi:hypothetical protein
MYTVPPQQYKKENHPIKKHLPTRVMVRRMATKTAKIAGGNKRGA